MALDLGDLNEYFDGGMYATVDGKRYRVPPVSAELGTWGRRAAVLRSGLGEDPGIEDLKRVAEEIGDPPVPDGLILDQALLSPELHAELLANGVNDEMVKHLAGIVYTRMLGGDKLALAFAHGEDGPKASNREQRRAAAKAKPRKASGSRTTSTAAEPTTRTAGSGSGTKSRTASAASARASRGRKS